jgi:hypothetical protein
VMDREEVMDWASSTLGALSSAVARLDGVDKESLSEGGEIKRRIRAGAPGSGTNNVVYKLENGLIKASLRVRMEDLEADSDVLELVSERLPFFTSFDSGNFTVFAKRRR